jgi:hypothetical protein
MGWWEGKRKGDYFNDDSEDTVSNFFKKMGYDYRKQYTPEERKKFYLRALRNKKLRKQFNMAYETSTLKRKAHNTEFQQSLRFNSTVYIPNARRW